MPVIWITGLSGAGKTTLAHELLCQFQQVRENVVLLDGDQLREALISDSFTPDIYSKKSRLGLAMQYAKLSKLISDQNIVVLVATISLFHEVHRWNRSNIRDYYEVYLKVSLEELRRRDPKGIYKRLSEGKVKNVAGFDLEIEEPKNPDLLVEFPSDEPTEKLANTIIKQFLGKGRKE